MNNKYTLTETDIKEAGNRPVRVRFAPSPTGGLHIGGVRTALFNYLFAQKHNGTFFLRIENTDQTRYVEGAEAYIFNALDWLGLNPSESPIHGGAFSPYRQSERKEIYQKYAMQLIESGFAYYAFDTPQQLEAMKQRLIASGASNPSYNSLTRMQMSNSLTLSKEEVKENLASGMPYVIRIKMPAKDEIRFFDMIRGWQKFHSSQLDDKVLMKSDGMPTYHLANVVDDYLMQTSHVIRGEEWLPSAPTHVLLYKYLGWEAQMPQWVHLPLILKPDLKDEKGQVIEKKHGKLSKRDAIDMGFPIFPLDWQEVKGYKESGYLPEALINFLALLGWNPGNEQEIFSLEELIQGFSIEKIHKAGAKFEIEKAKWFNQHYLRAKTEAELLPALKADLEANHLLKPDWDEAKLLKICTLMKERATFPQDLWQEAMYLFQAPTTMDEKAKEKNWNETSIAFVKSLAEELENFGGEWSFDNIKHILHELVEKQGLKFGKVMPAVRLALSGLGGGPDLAGIMEIIGKTETLARLNKAI
jgi:glutamyl-tRNA synthetase